MRWSPAYRKCGRCLDKTTTESFERSVSGFQYRVLKRVTALSAPQLHADFHPVMARYSRLPTLRSPF